MDDFKKTLTELLQANLDLETIAYAWNMTQLKTLTETQSKLMASIW